MADYTTKYNLIKPTGNENFSREHQNGNMDIIEQTMGENADDIVTLGESLASHSADNSKQVPHLGTTTNSGNAYSVTTTETIIANQKFTVKINATSTGTATLNISSIGSAKGIKKAGGLDATLKIGVYTLFYDGSNFQLLGEGGDYGTATADKVLTGNTIGTEMGIVSGTIPIRGSEEFPAWRRAILDSTPGTSGRAHFSIPLGAYLTPNAGQSNNMGIFVDDVNYNSTNILSGKNIFGLAGTLIPINPSAGGVIIGSQGAVQEVNNLAPIKVSYRYSLAQAGVYRTSFFMHVSDTSRIAYGRWFKNGVAFGTLRSNQAPYTAPINYVEDLTLNAGDYLELFLWQNVTGTVVVSNANSIGINYSLISIS